MARMGIEVHAVVPHRKGLAMNEVMSDVRVHRFQYMCPQALQTLAYYPGIPENIRTLSGKLQVPPFATSMAIKMLSVVRTFGIDVINAHWAIPPGFIATATSRIHGLPTVTTLYGAELFIGRQNPLLKRLLVRTMRASERVVAISPATAQTGVQLAAGKEIAVIPDGIDIQRFSPRNRGVEIRHRLGLADCRIVMTCGRMVERKGFQYLVSAMPGIVSRMADAKLIIIGDGPQKTKLQALASSLGVTDKVVFCGFVSAEDLPGYYAACDVFVLPSITDNWGDTEGSGTTVLEAMATGKPVIGTRVGGIPYALRTGCGFLVDEKDPSQLEDTIVRVLSDRDMAERLGIAGRGVVEGTFSWDIVTRQYVEQFKALVHAC